MLRWIGLLLFAGCLGVCAGCSSSPVVLGTDLTPEEERKIEEEAKQAGLTEGAAGQGKLPDD